MTEEDRLYANREARVRRLANSHGYALRKSRRDGSYSLVDIQINAVMYHCAGVDLDVVEGFLTS